MEGSAELRQAWSISSVPPGFGQGVRSEGMGMPCGTVPASCLPVQLGCGCLMGGRVQPLNSTSKPCYMTH